jgi:hypothetical protein
MAGTGQWSRLMTEEQQRDEETAAALEAALDYEDALADGGPPETDNDTDEKENWIMDERKSVDADDEYGRLREPDLAELIAALHELEADQLKVRQLCRRCAGEAPEAPVARASKPAGRTDAAPAGHVRAARIPPDPGQKNEPWKKVRCGRCGAVTGARLLAGKHYPTGHYDGDRICPGRGEPAELVIRTTPDQS